jgi:hypothetical protein
MGVYRIYLAQDKDQLPAVVYMEMNFQFASNVGSSLTKWKDVRLSKEFYVSGLVSWDEHNLKTETHSRK